MRAACAFLLAALFVPAADAQSVISARAGLIHYSEGAVFLDNEPVLRQFGRYASLRDGSVLATQDGRAEILLTPNAFLRLGKNSTIRMISGSLADAQIELSGGSAILDSGNAPAGAPLNLVVGDARIRIEKPSRLRVDAEPPQLRVEKGGALVTRHGSELQVEAGQRFPLADSSVAQRMTEGSDDLLDLWSMQRNRLIFLKLVSAQSIGDPGTDTGLTADAGLAGGYGAWTGLLPPATVLPNTDLFFPRSLPGYGYGYFGYNAPYYGFPGYGYGIYSPYLPRATFGYSFGSRYQSPNDYRYRPVSPAPPGRLPPVNPVFRTIPTRPPGSVPAGRYPAGGGARPVAPGVPAHR